MKRPMMDLQTVTSAIALGESPRWHDGRLWFCDWGAGEIVALGSDGKCEVVLRQPTFPFSIDWLPDGRLLVICDRKLSRLETDGRLVTHADLSPLAQYKWNEIVVDTRGQAYVNNVGFDFPGGAFAPGIIALVAPDGKARQVADGLAFPNGMAITADGGTLIVAESYGKRLSAFAIAADGSLSGRRVWAELGDGVPDGICVDAEGAVWYADVPNQRCVRVREGGQVLATIQLELGCFACMLGGEQQRTLYMVATEWRGSAAMAEVIRSRVGRVLAATAPAPHAGRP
jgi:sugar lactone lactonase YvrE